MTEKTRILFVCLGNIVRSPLAEAMFRYLAEQANVGDQYIVDSAGTSAYHIGETPDPRMRKVAAAYGLEYIGRARQFHPQDFDRFDWIIPMDVENRAALLRLARSPEYSAKVKMMRDFDPQASIDKDVPDPYYGGMDGFQEVYSIVERSCRGLLSALENQKGL